MRISGNTRGTMCKLLASWHRMENLHFVHTNLPGRYPPCSALVLATGCGNGLGRRFDAPLESWSWGFEGWGGPTSRANEQGASLGPHPLTSLLEAVALWIANGQDRRDAWARLVLLGGCASLSSEVVPCKQGRLQIQVYRCDMCRRDPASYSLYAYIYLCFDYLVQLLPIPSKLPLP